VGEAGLGKSRLVAEAMHVSGCAEWVETRPYPTPTNDQLPHGQGSSTICSTFGLTKIPTESTTLYGQSTPKSPKADFDRVYPYLARLLELPLKPELSAQLEILAAEVFASADLEAFQLYVKKRATCEANDRGSGRMSIGRTHHPSKHSNNSHQPSARFRSLLSLFIDE